MIAKILQNTVLVGIILTSMYSCKEETKENSKPIKVEKPKQTISYEYAEKLENEYIKTRGRILNKYLQGQDSTFKEDAREFWFDLNELKKYIAYVEYNAEKHGYKNLGIRIYNGAYPKNKKYPDPGYSTVFLVPTGTKSLSHGSSLPLNYYSKEDENIAEISPYNYGQAGRPPKPTKPNN